MNLKHLLFAQSVAETHSFSEAAEICYVTQPTLSNAISQLENELGGKLFIRTTKKVDVTAFGEYILPFIRTVLDDRNELEKAAHAYHNPEHQLLRIGLSPLIDMRLVVQVLEPYQQKHPKISIFFKECLLDDLERRLIKEQIDFAVIPKNLKVEKLFASFFYEEPLYYMPQEINLYESKHSQYKINELPDAQIILTGGGCGLNGSLEAIFQRENSELKVYPGQALSYKVIEEWASLGIGAGILPKAKISLDNKTAGLLLLSNGKPATLSYEWVWSNSALARKDISEFIGYLTTTLPVLVKGETKFAVV